MRTKGADFYRKMNVILCVQAKSVYNNGSYCVVLSKQDKKGCNAMNEKIMTKNITVVLLAAISCALWGSAPAGIKTGYGLFQIDASSTMNILLFAGLRFTLAGLMVVLGYSVMRRKPVLPRRSSWKAIFALSLAQTAVQYLFYYIGVAHTPGVKVSILSGSNTFFGVIIACLIFRQEKLTLQKFIGCLAGIAGIIVVNLQGSSEAFSMEMSLIGEGMVLLATISCALSAVLIRKFSQNEDPVMISGYQFMIGGLMLVVVALLGGGRLPNVTAQGLAILFYLGFLSAVAYTLWSLLLKYNPVSRVLVYHPLMPIFGVAISAIVLSEGGIFSWNTLISLILVCFGIWIINFSKNTK